MNLKSVNVPKDELPELAEACLVLPDYQNNPRVATLDDVKDILAESYDCFNYHYNTNCKYEGKIVQIAI